MTQKKTGFIGAGQMAQALASGIVAAGLIEPSDLMFAQPSEQRKKSLRKMFPGAELTDCNSEVFEHCDKIFLAVKPHILKAIAPELATHAKSDHLLISIAAGISLASLQEVFSQSRIIRVMPNTPVQVGVGASGMSAPADARENDLHWVNEMMSAVGVVVQVPDDLMHAVTGVAGSSPAYLYLVIEALSDGGVAMGLPRETATQLAAAAVEGAAKMVRETGKHPGALKDQVTSPGGTTIAAIRKLEASGIRSAMFEAVVACTERSRELS